MCAGGTSVLGRTCTGGEGSVHTVYPSGEGGWRLLACLAWGRTNGLVGIGEVGLGCAPLRVGRVPRSVPPAPRVPRAPVLELGLAFP